LLTGLSACVCMYVCMYECVQLLMGLPVCVCVVGYGYNYHNKPQLA
jgi:hypothetical protein